MCPLFFTSLAMRIIPIPLLYWDVNDVSGQICGMQSPFTSSCKVRNHQSRERWPQSSTSASISHAQLCNQVTLPFQHDKSRAYSNSVKLPRQNLERYSYLLGLRHESELAGGIDYSEPLLAALGGIYALQCLAIPSNRMHLQTHRGDSESIP